MHQRNCENSRRSPPRITDPLNTASGPASGRELSAFRWTRGDRLKARTQRRSRQLGGSSLSVGPPFEPSEHRPATDVSLRGLIYASHPSNQSCTSPGTGQVGDVSSVDGPEPNVRNQFDAVVRCLRDRVTTFILTFRSETLRRPHRNFQWYPLRLIERGTISKVAGFHRVKRCGS